MYNPITFVKDIIDLLKEPPGEAVAACEITPGNRTLVIETLEPRAAKYANTGDFLVEFETMVTIVPSKEFHKHYAFAVTPPEDETLMTRVMTIKPI